MVRLYKKLPCGCLVSPETNSLIPCSYPEAGLEETKLHFRCMELYFGQHKSVEEIWEIIRKESKESH